MSLVVSNQRMRIPGHWVDTRLGRVVRFANGADYREVETDEPGYPVYGSGGQFRWASDYLHDGPSVLFGRKGTLDRPLYVDGKFWTVDTMYYTIPNRRLIDPRFLYYWALRFPFDYYATNTAVPSMTQNGLSSEPLSLPPLLEQRRIVEFLDHETAEIDAFIVDLTRYKRLLLERHTSTINYHLDNTDWSVQPIKRVFKSLNHMRVPLSADQRGEMQGDVPYYGASGQIDQVNDYIFDEDLVLVSEDGANLLMRSTPIAFPVRGKAWVNNHAHILRPPSSHVELWSAVIQIRDIAPFVTGSAQPKFTAEALANFPISVPPEKHWEQLNSFILQLTRNFETGYSEVNEAVKLSKERRSALISAAVTGQIDVSDRYAAEKVYEEVESVQ